MLSKALFPIRVAHGRYESGSYTCHYITWRYLLCSMNHPQFVFAPLALVLVFGVCSHPAHWKYTKERKSSVFWDHDIFPEFDSAQHLQAPANQSSFSVHVCQQGLPHLNAWMMTVPKTMKRAEKIKDRIGIISRLAGKKWSKKRSLDWNIQEKNTMHSANFSFQLILSLHVDTL